MMPYKNTKTIVRSPEGDTNIFDIIAGVLQENTFGSFLFMLGLDNKLRASIDLKKKIVSYF